MSAAVKIIRSALLWAVLFSTGQPTRCFFLLNPLNYLPRAQTPQFKAQPITFKVPKDRISELSKLLQTNPNFLKGLTAASGQIPQQNGASTFSTIPIGNRAYNPQVITSELPKETMINGQRFVLSSRAEILRNRGINALRNVLPTMESIPTVNPLQLFADNFIENNLPSRSQKEKDRKKERKRGKDKVKEVVVEEYIEEESYETDEEYEDEKPKSKRKKPDKFKKRKNDSDEDEDDSDDDDEEEEEDEEDEDEDDEDDDDDDTDDDTDDDEEDYDEEEDDEEEKPTKKPTKKPRK